MKRTIPIALLCMLSFFNSVASSQNTFWQKANLYYQGKVSCIAMNQQGHIYIGTSKHGILYSKDSGETWIPINTGLIGPRIYTLAINANGHVFVGTSHGLFRSIDDSKSWNRILTDTIQDLDISSNGYIFAVTSSGVRRSTDNGETWAPIIVRGIKLKQLYINKRGHIFARNERSESPTIKYPGKIVRSTDDGDNWYEVDIEIVISMAFDSKNNIYAGVLWGGIFQSTDEGKTWNQIAFPGKNIREITASLNNNIYVWVEGEDVYYSKDNGKDWTSTGLADVEVYTLLSDLIGNIFAGTSSGVYKTGNSPRVTAVGNTVEKDQIMGHWESVNIEGEAASEIESIELIFTVDRNFKWTTVMRDKMQPEQILKGSYQVVDGRLIFREEGKDNDGLFLFSIEEGNLKLILPGENIHVSLRKN
jgi:photosystem II stability/assembly factor-like uncharacterized protein